jgi:hypothetical protein
MPRRSLASGEWRPWSLPVLGTALLLGTHLRLATYGGVYLKRSPLRLLGITGDRECCAPAYFEGSIMRQSQRLSSVIPFAAIQRPACPKCKVPMMLASIEPARGGLDWHTFECAICNHELKTLVAHEDPMKSRDLGRWLLGDLHPPK